MKKKISILIADDHKMIRRGVKLVLDSASKYNFSIHETSHGREVLNLMEEFQFDIVLLDLSMPDLGGIEILEKLRNVNSEVPVLVQSMHKEENIVREVIKYGAAGFILKSTEDDELILAIETVLKREHYFSPEIMKLLANNVMNLNSGQGVNFLSSIELKVISMLVKEMTSDEIALTLNLSKRTIE